MINAYEKSKNNQAVASFKEVSDQKKEKNYLQRLQVSTACGLR